MNRPYYVLMQRDEYGLWWPQFGDYSKEFVAAERADYIESGRDNPNALKVVRCEDDTDKAIMGKAAALYVTA